MYIKNTRLWRGVVAAAAILIVSVSTNARAEDFMVVVNADNPFSGDEGAVKAQLKRLFLKDQRDWPGGISAIPFGRDPEDPAQKAFATEILGMSESELDAHWLKLKQTAGETPPKSIGSARILVRQIAKNPGAFGLIAKSEAGDVPEGVKVLIDY